MFRFTSIKSHWRMLCPNTRAVTNGYSTGWGPRPFSPKRVEIWIWGLEKLYEKRRPNHIFPQEPTKIGCVDGENGKKVYEKRGKQVFVLTNWRFIIKFFVYRQDFSCIILYVLVMILSSQCFTNDNNSKLNICTDYRYDWPRYMTRTQCTCLHRVRVSVRAV